MIHALDPVFIVEKIACSRIDVVVPIDEVIEQTITGVKGIGGSETRGKFRWAMPKQYYISKINIIILYIFKNSIDIFAKIYKIISLNI